MTTAKPSRMKSLEEVRQFCGNAAASTRQTGQLQRSDLGTDNRAIRAITGGVFLLMVVSQASAF